MNETQTLDRSRLVSSPSGMSSPYLNERFLFKHKPDERTLSVEAKQNTECGRMPVKSRNLENYIYLCFAFLILYRENDEKPTAATAAAAAAAVARDISNGNSSRGDPGIKVSTQTQSIGNMRERIDEGENNGGETGQGKKNVESRSTPVTTALNRSTSEQCVGAVGSGSGGREKSTAEAAAALFNNNFRLHTNLGKMHQSVEVCRINSMFGGQKSTAGKRLNGGVVGSANSSDSNCSLAASTGDLRSNKAGGYHNNNHRGTVATGVVGGSAKDLRRSSSSPQGRPDLPLMPTMMATAMLEPKSLTDVNHNSLTKWSAER